MVASSRRAGALLNRRRVLLFASVVLAVETTELAFIGSGLCNRLWPSFVLHTDFISFYAAGRLADAGMARLAYMHAAHHVAELAVAPGLGDYKFFYYPPVFLLLCAPLAHLSFSLAFSLFEAATLAAFALVVRLILDHEGWPAVLPALAFPSLFIDLYLGQNALLTASLFGAATLLIDRRPALAGILFGILSYKPHLGLLIPVALAAGGHWRAFRAALSTVAGLCLLSLALFGWATWQQFLTSIFVSAHVTYGSQIVPLGTYVSPFGAVRLLGGRCVTASGVQAVVTVAVAIFVAEVWRRRLPLSSRAATLIGATLAATPVIFVYDLMLGVVAVAWLVRDGPLPAWGRIVVAACFLLVPEWRVFSAWHLPIVPLAAVTVLALTATRVCGGVHCPTIGVPGSQYAAAETQISAPDAGSAGSTAR